jgi:hypothetical protein
MGYGGKVLEQQRARELRAQAWTLQDIATELGVSTSSVSLWVRGVEFTPRPRNRGLAGHRPHPLHARMLSELDRCRVEGLELVGQLAEREFLILGLALYAGEGSKSPGEVRFANSDPRMIVVFITWLQHFFEIDESRLRVRLYLHRDLDEAASIAYWSDLVGVPPSQFHKPYRAAADASLRRNRHIHGCPAVSYACTSTHRRVMGMVSAVLSATALSGVAQLAERLTVNQNVVGSSPTPGARHTESTGR